MGIFDPMGGLVQLVILLLLNVNAWGYLHHKVLSRRISVLGNGMDGSSYFDSVMCNVRVPGNVTATLVNLITLGDDFSTPNKDKRNFYEGIPAHWQRVPGCMADARVFTTLIEHHNTHSDDKNAALKVKVEGVADSRVAQGLVALLSHGLSDMTASEVLALSGEELTKRCKLDDVLPPGRMNGLQNMLTIIQEQIAKFLDTSSSPPSSPPSDEDSVSMARGADWKDDEIAMLISGGVDSSVALKLLLDQGHRVRAFYLKIWLEDEVAHLNECPWEEDLHYAQQVCDQLGVPLETVSLQKEYWDKVVQYTFDEARLGRTPNPDIMCNSRIKFGMFYEYVGKHFQKVATGHYAQVRTMQDGTAELFMSPDSVKDQTYFLCNLRQDQLQRCLFPIGHLQKQEVRRLAEQYQLATEKRKDSQGICFLGKLKFDDFIFHYLGEAPGPIKEYKSERVLGEHKGLWYHTIGQRKGVGSMLGPGVVNDGPWYVCAKEAETNTLYITNDLQLVEKPRREFVVDRMNWIRDPFTSSGSRSDLNEHDPSDGIHSGNGGPVKQGIELDIRLRHGPAITRGTVTLQGDTRLPLSEGTSSRRAKICLVEKDKGIAPGQFAAFYKDGICLGAGVISEVAQDKD